MCGGGAALQYSPWLRHVRVMLALLSPGHLALALARWVAVPVWLGSLGAQAGAYSTSMGALLNP